MAVSEATLPVFVPNGYDDYDDPPVFRHPVPRIVDRWVEVRGRRIHYLTGAAPMPPRPIRGEAVPPLLFLHGGGLGSAALTYEQCLLPLARFGQTIALDWPGYGGSDDHGGTHSTDGYIAFLAEFLDALGLGRVRLCGHSMGGGVALGFALRYPERVDRLILVNSHGLGGDVPCHVVSNLIVRVPYVNTLSWSGVRRLRWFMKRSLKSVLHDPSTITEDLIARSCTLVRTGATARAWRRWQQSEVHWTGFRTNFVGALPALSAPTLILHGGTDTIIPIAWAERATALIRDCELRVFPTCGHWLTRDRPDSFIRAVAAFLGRREAGAA